MSGHSHWATIRSKKETQDKAKGTVFAKISKELTLAIQKGGGVIDPELNAYLRGALLHAKEVNLPKENIQRAIDRSRERAEHLHEALYEGFGPGGAAYLVSTVTDNTNRTLTDLRLHFSKGGGKLGGQGSVVFMFRHVGVFTFETIQSEDKIQERENAVLACIDAIKAYDFEEEEGNYYAYVDYDNLSEALEKAREMGFDKALHIGYVPNDPIELSSEDYDRALRLKESLEELEDVHEVYTNVMMKES